MRVIKCMTLSDCCFRGGSVIKNPPARCRRHKRYRFNPWVRNSPWSQKGQPIPAFLPGKFHRKSSLVGYRPGVTKRLNDWAWSDWMVSQESCAQPEITILHLGKNLSSNRRTLQDLYQMVMCPYTPWGGASTRLYCCTIVPWLFLLCFCTPSLL